MKVVSSFDSFAQHTESTKVYFRQKKCRFLRSPEMDRNLEVKAWLKKTLPNELANIFCGAEGQGSGCRCWATMPVFNQGDFDQATNFKSFVTESSVAPTLCLINHPTRKNRPTFATTRDSHASLLNCGG